MTRLSICFVAMVMALGLALPSLAQNPPQEVLRATHGDWEVRCIDGTDVCAMSQFGSTAAGERALLVTVQRISGVTADNGITIPGAMTVQAPLGILLPYGIRLKVDADPVVPLPLNRCLPVGCVSQAPMREEEVAKMKAGSTAVFGFFLDKEVIVNISLRGFTKAYNSLTPVNANNQ